MGTVAQSSGSLAPLARSLEQLTYATTFTSSINSADPAAYCKAHPNAGCCKDLLSVSDECEPYFQEGGVHPDKLCPSKCAQDLLHISQHLAQSGERDGVCPHLLQGISFVVVGCNQGSDGGFCYDQINRIGQLLNASSSVEKAELANVAESMCAGNNQTASCAN